MRPGRRLPPAPSPAAPRSSGEGARARRDAGYLLTETLATFTLSAFVLLGLVSSASVLLRAVDHSVAHIQQVDDLGRAMAAVTRDIATLSRARWAGEEPQNFVFRGSANTLFFARSEAGADGLVEKRVVALREIMGPAGPQMARADAHLSATATSFDDLSFGPQRALPTGPARLHFYYLPAPKKDQPPPPRELSWPVGPVLPVAVIVEAVDPVSGRLIVTARVPIRANADVGCIAAANDGGAAALAAAGGLPAAPAQTSQNPAEPANPDQAAAAVPGTPNAPTTGADSFCGRSDKDDKAAVAAPGAAPEAGAQAASSGAAGGVP